MHRTPMRWYGEYLWSATIDETPAGDFGYKVCATDTPETKTVLHPRR